MSFTGWFKHRMIGRTHGLCSNETVAARLRRSVSVCSFGAWGRKLVTREPIAEFHRMGFTHVYLPMLPEHLRNTHLPTPGILNWFLVLRDTRSNVASLDPLRMEGHFRFEQKKSAPKDGATSLKRFMGN